MTLQETITASAEYLLTHVTNRPTVALVLGSGLGDFADTLENPVRVPYKDIPNFPQTTVAGAQRRFRIRTALRPGSRRPARPPPLL